MDVERLNELTARHAQVWRHNARQRRMITTPLAPVNAYIIVSALVGWRGWPSRLRAIREAAEPAELGARGRAPASDLRQRRLFATVNLLLMGREAELCEAHGQPGDRAADLAAVLELWEGFARAHRRDGHVFTHDAGGLNPVFDEPTVSELAVAAQPVDADTRADRQRALAALELFAFLMNVESRSGREDSGPYELPDGRRLVVREIWRLSANELSWSDVARDVPHGTVVVPMVLSPEVHAELDDFGNTFTEPEQYFDHVEAMAVLVPTEEGGLRRLSDEELHRQVDAVRAAQTELYRRLATASRAEQIRMGAEMHWKLPLPFARAAGLDLDWSLPEETDVLAADMDDDRARELIVATSGHREPYTPVPAGTLTVS